MFQDGNPIALVQFFGSNYSLDIGRVLVSPCISSW